MDVALVAVVGNLVLLKMRMKLSRANEFDEKKPSIAELVSYLDLIDIGYGQPSLRKLLQMSHAAVSA